MFNIFKKIILVLTKHERWRLFWLFVAIIIVATIEVAGIVSIMPFMAVVGNPEVIEKNQYLFWAYRTFGFTSSTSFLVTLGTLVFCIILISNLFKAVVLWFELHFVHFRLCNISERLFYRYLSEPYVFFLSKNTTVLGKNILQEVSGFSHHVLRPLTQILSRFVVVVFVLGLLVVVDPVLAVVVGFILGGAYIILFVIIQKKIARLGEGRFEANALRFKTASEAFGGIKELKVLRRERSFFDLFSVTVRKLEGSYVKSELIAQLPSYVMEVFAFGGIMIIILYFLIIRQDLDQTLPVMALYAFAGYRLMPAMQGIFSAGTLLRFNVSVLEEIHRDLAGTIEIPADWQRQEVIALPFQKEIQLEGISFAYPAAQSPVINNLNMTIIKNTNVGFVGTTGSGKTTTIDIILGLLAPQAGKMMIDGVPITSDNVAQWQRNLGYVPQSIFLRDDTLAANIAFGEPPDSINMGAVEEAARIANLHDFVVNDLPDGYRTNVGERGVRLSGGQRQRISIARALYCNPDVLIMDEATSALDGVTEEAVIQAIRNLAGEKTIITIAHRLTTLKDCDQIYVMRNGQVVEQGTYDELSDSSFIFQAMSNPRSK